MGVKAVKFGGSSLADAGQFQKVREILLSDPARRFVVPSAPGRRFDGDDKVTDLLYRCHFAARAGENGYVYFEKAAARYREIAAALHLKTDVDALLQKTFAAIPAGIWKRSHAPLFSFETWCLLRPTFKRFAHHSE